MRELDEVVWRLVIAQRYLEQFRQRGPAVGNLSLSASEHERMGAALNGMRQSGVIPEAEFVTIESVFESLDDQPGDVVGVFARLVAEWEELKQDPASVAAVGACRRCYFPGVLEERVKHT